MKFNKKQILIWLSLFIFFIVMVFLQLSRPMVPTREGMGDAEVRISDIVNNNIPQYGVWQPLYFYILKFSIDRGGTYIGPRIMGALSFFLLTVVFYLFTQKLFKNYLVSALSVIFFLTSSYFTDYLTFPLTGVLFSLFLLLAIYFLICHKNYWQLFLSITFYSLANALRFESWVLLPILTVYLYRKSKNLQITFWYTTLCLIYPLYYLGLNYSHTSNFIYPLIDYKEQNVYQGTSFYAPFYNWFKEFILNFNPILFATLVASLTYKEVRKIISKNEKFIFLICGTFLLILFLLRMVVRSSLWYPDEYLFFPILILYPFAGYAAYFLTKKYKIMFLVFIIAILISLENNFYFKTSRNQIPKVSSYLQNIKGNCLYVLDPNNFPYDKDLIMYLGDKIEYSSTSISEYKNIYTNDFSCFIFDKIANIPNNELNKSGCEIYFTDIRFKLYKCGVDKPNE